MLFKIKIYPLVEEESIINYKTFQVFKQQTTSILSISLIQ